MNMKWQGLITDEQHRAGYGSTMDEDFIYIWHGRDGSAACIAVLEFETTTVKDVRDVIESHAGEGK